MSTSTPPEPCTPTRPLRRLALPLQGALLTALLAACATAQTSAPSAPEPAPGAQAVRPAGTTASSERPPSAEDTRRSTAPAATPAAPARPPATRADLERLQERLPQAAEWTEMDAMLRDLRAALRDLEGELAYAELLQIEHGVTASVARWVENRTDRRGLARGAACLADVQCADGTCTGSGCVPGSWTCTPRLRRDQPVTTDMRRACLCSGITFEGSSTVLSTRRVRSTGSACPEELRFRPDRRRPH